MVDSSKFCCYVCDNETSSDTSDKLLPKLTITTKVSFPKIISTLISDEFVLVVGKEDVICNHCSTIVNKLDLLQYEAGLVRKMLTEFLEKKYHIPIYDSCETDDYSSNVERKVQNNIAEVVLSGDSWTNQEENENDQSYGPPLDINKLKINSNKKKCENSEVFQRRKLSTNQCIKVETSSPKNVDNVDMLVSEVSIDSSDYTESDYNQNKDVKGSEEEVDSERYLVCELCLTTIKTASELDNHECRRKTLSNEDSGKGEDTIFTESESRSNVKNDGVYEITIVEGPKEKVQANEPLKKDLSVNLCCFVCDTFLASRSELALHVLSHYPIEKGKKKGTICPVCNAYFKSLIDFMNHYDQHVNSNSSNSKSKESTLYLNKDGQIQNSCFQCKLCKTKTNNIEELSEHRKIKHNVYTCQGCLKEFPSYLKLKEHSVIHDAKIKPNQCVYCLNRFDSPKQLQVHLDTIHDQIKVTKACPLCRKKCSSTFSIKNHVFKDHLIPVLKQEIRENYSRGSDLVDDMKSLGASEKIIKSITDTNKLTDLDKIKNLKIIVNVEASDVSFCLLCGFSSKSVPNLDKHREKHSIKKIPCPLFCDYLSCDSDELNLHLSESHNLFLTENYCPHCLSEPNEEIILHMKALHGKLYTHLMCYVCKELFFTKENLKYHFSMTHLISEQRFSDKGDNTEVDDYSHDADDPLENTDSELTIALESITDTSSQPAISLEDNQFNDDNHTKNEHTDQNQEPNSDITFETNKDSDVSKFVCAICRNVCESDVELSLHMGLHSENSKNLECDMCQELLHDEEHVKAHILKNHHQNLNSYCFLCYKSFNSKSTFMKHLTKCSYRTCIICSKQFKTATLFFKHLSYSHRKDMNCTYCQKLCRSIKNLYYHESLHVKYKGKVFECGECSKTFFTPNGLKVHTVSHTGNYPYVCEFCGRGFITAYALSEHRASHTGDIRYCCEICGKSFRLYDTYHRHRRQHDDPFPSRCNLCGKRFRNASRVAEHKRKVHTGERPYACPYCPMAFTVTSSYRIHLCKHTKIYPYNCDSCQRGFVSRFKYANHLATKHNDSSYVTTPTATPLSEDLPVPS